MSLTQLPLTPTRVAPTPPAPGSGGTDPAVGDYDTTPGAINLTAGDVLFVVCMFASSVTDDAGNSWSLVASQGNLQVWRCGGTVNLGAADVVHTFGSTTPKLVQFARGSWAGIAATVHLDVVPIETVQATVAGPGIAGFINVPAITEYTSASEVLLAMAQTNSSFPTIASSPNFNGFGSGPNLRDENFSRTFPVIGGQVNNPPGYGTGLTLVSPTCSANHGGWSTQQQNAATYSVDYIVLVFQVVESAVCPGHSGDGGAGQGMIRACRGAGVGQLFTAHVLDAELIQERYDDALPEAVEDSNTLEAADAQATELIRKADGALLLLYAVANSVYLRESRDQGGTWGLATTIASNYQGVAAALDEATGMLVVALYKASTTTWFLTIGSLNAAGTTWSFTTPASLQTAARNGAHLQRRRDGVWEFFYVSNSDVATIKRCRKLLPDGTGTWS